MPIIGVVGDYREYWRQIVTPDFEDFDRDKADIRIAFHLAVSLFHMADWIYVAHKQTIDATFTYRGKNDVERSVNDEKSFANALAETNPSFELIRGIANSAKHLILRNKGRHPSSPSDAASTVVQSTGFGMGDFGSGPFSGTPRVMLRDPIGTDLEFRTIASAVMTMWKELSVTHEWNFESY